MANLSDLLGGAVSNVEDVETVTSSSSDPAIDSNPSATGHLWINTTSGEVYVCTDATAGENVWTNMGDGGGSVPPPQLALFGGGNSNIIDYVTITTAGNATDFGDLLATIRDMGAFSSATRGIWACGGNNVIQYVTIMSTGNATDFGDATGTYSYLSGCSNSTRGIFGGGYQGGLVASLEYITIATLGNAVSFGNLTEARYGLSSVASATRAIFANGNKAGAFSNVIDYHSIASTGNFSDFGDTTMVRRDGASSSNATRGIFGGSLTYPGSSPYSNVLDYITLATTGNAIDFGDATALFKAGQSAAGRTKALFSLGVVSGSYVNTIDQVTIATTGNATDFGDLTVARAEGGACSSAHGGV